MGNKCGFESQTILSVPAVPTPGNSLPRVIWKWRTAKIRRLACHRIHSMTQQINGGSIPPSPAPAWPDFLIRWILCHGGLLHKRAAVAKKIFFRTYEIYMLRHRKFEAYASNFLPGILPVPLFVFETPVKKEKSRAWRK